MTEIKVLDHGYVKLIDHMGDDASIANAARVSYDKGTKKVSDDRNLIRYLVRNFHTSPVEMVEFVFELKAPLFIIQQILRHRTANINQMSLRYSEAIDEFYIPELERLQPQSKTNNQGSEGKLSEKEAQFAQSIIRDISSDALDSYKLLLGEYNVSKVSSDVFYTGSDEERQGISRELARAILPHSNYSKLVWKMDLKNLLHFINLRADSHSQWEIQQYANAIHELIKPFVPITVEAHDDYVREAVNVSRMEKNLLSDLLTADISAKEKFKELITQHGSEDELMKHYGLSKREWSETKSKLSMD